jgi:hypothetical protein
VCQECQRLRIPAGLVYRLAPEVAEGRVQKTTRRQVVTLQFARAEVLQVHRQPAAGAAASVPPLARLVPKGGSYGYDLIAHVGCETFLRGRSLSGVAQELPPLPFSSLYDVQAKFLFYLGHLHRQRAAAVAERLRNRGGGTWLIDATLEPDTPLYFGIYEAQEKILLEAYRIATESAEAITPCLQQTAARFGAPRRVLHDLSDAMAAACTQVWPQVTHSVCHFHLLRDIGEDLYATPQARLRDRLQHLKLQPRLKEQRNTQTDWLREHPESSTVLADVLAGQPVELSSATAGRELLLAVQQWLLDYPRDGTRQGFPFDPYLLYFHRRVIRASAAVERLLQDSHVAGLAPLALKNFARLLREYLGDPAIQAAAGQYEAAWTLFQRLRTLLRLEAQGAAPLHDRYLLDELQAAEVQQSLAEFRAECQQRSVAEAEEASRERYQIVWEHLERYWGQLFAAADDPCRERTTNGLEGWWGSSKRGCRRRHGRKKLTREFRSLPAEFMLVGNLANPEYVELVLDGDLSNLAAKLAEAGRTAGAWTAWRAAQQPLNRGRLPQRLIRRDDFLDELTACYDEHCHQRAA